MADPRFPKLIDKAVAARMLSDPSISVQEVAQHFNMSMKTLYKRIDVAGMRKG